MVLQWDSNGGFMGMAVEWALHGIFLNPFNILFLAQSLNVIDISGYVLGIEYRC